jgi:hypothetical protein
MKRKRHRRRFGSGFHFRHGRVRTDGLAAAKCNTFHLRAPRWGRRWVYVVCQRCSKAADHERRWSAPLR